MSVFLVSIGLVWESAKSGSQHIRDVVNGIGTTLDLSEVTLSNLCRNILSARVFVPILIKQYLLYKVLFAFSLYICKPMSTCYLNSSPLIQTFIA